jgi:hypothetical protein
VKQSSELLEQLNRLKKQVEIAILVVENAGLVYKSEGQFLDESSLYFRPHARIGDFAFFDFKKQQPTYGSPENPYFAWPLQNTGTGDPPPNPAITS